MSRTASAHPYPADCEELVLMSQQRSVASFALDPMSGIRLSETDPRNSFSSFDERGLWMIVFVTFKFFVYANIANLRCWFDACLRHHLRRMFFHIKQVQPKTKIFVIILNRYFYVIALSS